MAILADILWRRVLANALVHGAVVKVATGWESVSARVSLLPAGARIASASAILFVRVTSSSAFFPELGQASKRATIIYGLAIIPTGWVKVLLTDLKSINKNVSLRQVIDNGHLPLSRTDRVLTTRFPLQRHRSRQLSPLLGLSSSVGTQMSFVRQILTSSGCPSTHL